MPNQRPEVAGEGRWLARQVVLGSVAGEEATVIIRSTLQIDEAQFR